MLQDIVFAAMLVIALGAGIATAAYEMGFPRSKSTSEELNCAENAEKEGND